MQGGKRMVAEGAVMRTEGGVFYMIRGRGECGSMKGKKGSGEEVRGRNAVELLA